MAACQASLFITISRSSLRLMSIESVMPSSHFILGRPLLLLPPIPPRIRIFSNESTLRMRYQKYWSFSFSIIPSKEIPGLISFRMDWLDLLAVQGTLKSLLQSHSSNASILWCSAFFTVQLSHPYMTTGNTIALTIQTYVGQVISLLFNMLSRVVAGGFRIGNTCTLIVDSCQCMAKPIQYFKVKQQQQQQTNLLSRLVITFLPRSKHLLISWLQSPSAVILWPPKIKSDTVSIVSHLFPMK